MLLALDLATNTGWCAGSGAEAPELGSVRMPDTGEEIGPFASFFAKWFAHQLRELQPTIVGFEAPLLPRAKIDANGYLVQAPTTDATQTKLKGLKWEVERQCYDAHIDCRETFGATVKKELSGRGDSKKPDMMLAAKRCGLAPRNFDEADAFGVWLVMVRYHAKQHLPLWDQLRYGDRPGALRI